MTNFNDEENKLKPQNETSPKQNIENNNTGLFKQPWVDKGFKNPDKVDATNSKVPKTITPNYTNPDLEEKINNTGLFKQPWVDKGFKNPDKVDTINFKMPNINTGIKTHNIKQINNNPNDFGKDKNGKEFQLTPIQKDQREYFDLIQKKRSQEGFPKNPTRTGNIGIFKQPNWRGGTVEMTESEYNNIPSSMNKREKEKLKFMLEQKGTGNFDIHWEKIKDKVDILPKEIKGLNREKFNKLNDEDKLRLYNDFVQYERKQKENGDNQKVEQGKQEDNQVKTQETSIDLEENLKQQEQVENSKDNKDGSDEGLQKELSVLSEEVGNKINIENGELIIEGLKNEKGENFKLNLYNEKGELKNKTELELEISKFYSRTIASIGNNNTKMSEEQEKSNGVLSKVWNWLIPTAHAPYDEGNKKETNQYTLNPNYGNYNETIKYYEDKGINYDFTINTNSEFYDEDKAIIKQDNIINILGNKDLLHEVKLYPNGEEFKKDEKGNILKDKDGKKIENESKTMYQVREDGDRGGKQYSVDGYKNWFKGQCAYFTSRILKEAYPDLINKDGYNPFDISLGASSLISQADVIKDSEGKLLFEATEKPTIGSIYCNPDEPFTNKKGHVALVTDVKKNKDGTYDITFLEQNSVIKIDGKEYKPIRDTNSENFGSISIRPEDHSLVIGERTKTIKVEKPIRFFQKRNN